MSKDFNYNTTDWKKLSAAVIKRDGAQCQYCGTTEGVMTADHVIPRSKGGTDSMDNLITACRPCNSTKNDKTAWRVTWISKKWLS